ncbi:MAG: transcriptional regulator [Deltaproteobacteria bacterium]|nr:transcriptional regulator [Deltaproteobacteria bacterium]
MKSEEQRQAHRLLSFEPFRLDIPNAQLWRGPEVIRLTNKALAVLCHLTERSGQLVTKEELFTAVWPGIVVSDSALVTCIGELRRALGDARQTPQFIETVHGRGYGFIAAVSTTPPVVSCQSAALPRFSSTGHWELATDHFFRASPALARQALDCCAALCHPQW